MLLTGHVPSYLPEHLLEYADSKVVSNCHTPRFMLVPQLRAELEVKTPADRGPGRAWAMGPAFEWAEWGWAAWWALCDRGRLAVWGLLPAGALLAAGRRATRRAGGRATWGWWRRIGGDPDHPQGSPLRAPDLCGLPRAARLGRLRRPARRGPGLGAPAGLGWRGLRGPPGPLVGHGFHGCLGIPLSAAASAIATADAWGR
ncbi:hypothetical protein [Streptomyces sp. NPDC059072]|uniref:hypothetical protein n=1 Tax=Streptomyces sp. NPDC059072 TaxID=3346715 RepID=UPI0036AC5AA7